MPSVHSSDLWLKWSCKNMVSSCWKSSKSPLHARLATVCYQLRVRCNYMQVPCIKGVRRSGLRGLGGVFIHLVWLPVIEAIRFYMERSSYWKQHGIQFLWHKTMVQNHPWLSWEPHSPCGAAGTCPFPQLFSRWEESREGWCAHLLLVRSTSPAHVCLMPGFSKPCGTAILSRCTSGWVYGSDSDTMMSGTGSFNTFSSIVHLLNILSTLFS